MWDFVKKIFSDREGKVTIVVIDDNDPEHSSSFKLQSIDMIKLAMVVIMVSVLITILILFATPLGTLYQIQNGKSVRQEVIDISERVLALEDSLQARDLQLQNMREVLRAVPDTTLPVESDSNGPRPFITEENMRLPESGFQTYDMLSKGELVFSERLNAAADFPANYPLEGSLTQGFSAEQGHYGIDIAAGSNTPFRALADGTVVNAGWTINYGYVIYIQHANGIISVYKHVAKLLKHQGDFVLKGDILGEIGDRGVLSSGSHLHLEIWKNGVPQNPLMYLMN